MGVLFFSYCNSVSIVAIDSSVTVICFNTNTVTLLVSLFGFALVIYITVMPESNQYCICQIFSLTDSAAEVLLTGIGWFSAYSCVGQFTLNHSTHRTTRSSAAWDLLYVRLQNYPEQNTLVDFFLYLSTICWHCVKMAKRCLQSVTVFMKLQPTGWWRGSVVERWSLASELSLSCARHAADG